MALGSISPNHNFVQLSLNILVKSWPEMASNLSTIKAILALSPPTSVKTLRHFLGLVQYYQDTWEKRSEILAPLTDLVGGSGIMKKPKQKGTNKIPFHWAGSNSLESIWRYKDHNCSWWGISLPRLLWALWDIHRRICQTAWRRDNSKGKAYHLF